MSSEPHQPGSAGEEDVRRSGLSPRSALALLDRVARITAARSDAAGMAASVLDALVRGLEADGGALCRVEGDHLVELASVPPPPAPRDPRAIPLAGTFHAELLAMPEARRFRPEEMPADAAGELGALPPEAVEVASVPVLSRGLALGLLRLHRCRHEAGPFDESALAVLSTAATQIGPGLDLALGKSGEHSAGLQPSVLHRIAVHAGRELEISAVVESCLRLSRELSGADWSTVYLLDDEGRRFELAGGQILDATGLDLRALPIEVMHPSSLGSSPALLPVGQLDSPYREACIAGGMRLALTLPLLAGGRLTGLMALGFRTERRFEPAALDALASMAEQQALALELARSQERSQQRARLAGLVREAAEGVLSAATEEQAWEALLHAGAGICRSDAAHLALLDAAGALSVVHSIHDTGAPPTLAPLAPGDPLLLRLEGSAGPFRVEAADTAALGAWRPLVAEQGWPDLMLLPLSLRGRLAGAIVLQARQVHRASAEEIEAKGLIASLATSALDALFERRVADEQRARLRQIVEHLPLPAAVLDAQGRFEQINAAYREIVPGGAIGMRWADAIGNIDLRGAGGATVPVERLHVSRALRGESPPPSDLRLQSGDGPCRHLLTHTAPLRGPAGEITGVTIAIQDVTHLRELAEAKDRFIDMASHELRAPLTNLRACAALLEMDPAARTSEERRKKLVDRLHTQVDRLSRLVDDLVEVARVRGGLLRLSRERLDLAELASEVVELAELTSEDHRPVSVTAPEPVWGLWDRQRIAQVVTNLVSNATRYSPRGSEVRVAVEGDATTARVTVTDEGIGIEPQLIARLFEPYVRGDAAGRSARGGLGLGLHISQEIVRHHDGRIEVESQPGRGSRFTVVLPRGL